MGNPLRGLSCRFTCLFTTRDAGFSFGTIMIILNLDQITRHFGAHDVLNGVSWAIQRGTVTGLVGPNGCGKTTLFQILAGEDAADGGSIFRLPGLSVGRLAQEPVLDPERTVLQEALTAAPELRALEGELRGLEDRMADPVVFGDERKLQNAIEAHARVLETFTAAGGPQFAGRITALLRAFGFDEVGLELPVRVLSGGQKKLVGLAKVLVEQPDLLLLDEPDNHLDLAGKHALERFIVEYPGTVVIISHDRYLLDVVADHIVDLDGGTATAYKGNYTEYTVERDARRVREQKAFDLQQRELQRLDEARRRLISWSSGGQNEKMIIRARNIERRMERMPKVEAPSSARKGMGLSFGGARGGDKVLEITGLDKAFGATVLFEGLDLLVWRGERVGLVGPNGVGKSVLFKIIRGEMSADAGKMYLGPSINLGYYAQEHQTLDRQSRVLDEIRRLKPMSEGEALGFLGRFLFPRPMALKSVDALSGGEKSRLQIAKLVLDNPNFLLLDEPTNNFDIQSAEILEAALDGYSGTVLTISHDRYFLDSIATRIVELEAGAFTDYPGNYTDYVTEKARRQAAKAAADAARSAASASRARPPNRSRSSRDPW